VVGVQTMLAMILVVPRPQHPDMALMTRLGSGFFQPDRDIPIYLGGCALSVVLTLGLCGYWRAIMDSIKPLHRIGYLRRAGRIQSRVAAFVAVFGAAAIGVARWLPHGLISKWNVLLILIAPVAAALVAALTLLRKNGEVDDSLPASGNSEDPWVGPRPRISLLGAIAAVCLVIGVLYIPAWRMMAGILDGADATYYLGSGCKPSDRYIPILAGMIWKRQFEGVRDRFLGHRFDFVAMRCGDAAKGHAGDEDLSEIARRIEPDYELDSRCGSFGIWRRKDLDR
jgi:hypothetical protein